ncbi:MAG: beta-lactamase family protein [Proteobacteria bacterium]|nr:beta-lactamase family protein [Pseudomonadota bacterium]
MKETLEKALQNQLNRALKREPCLGVNVAVGDEANGWWSGAAGFLEPEAETPLPADALFYVYSITKTFTASRILQLAELGKLRLDDPVDVWLPDLKFPAAVTLRRLLNHTAGVPNHTELESYQRATYKNPSNPWSDEYVLELTCRRELDFEPGESWAYSNTGYMLLRKVIEAAAGRTYAREIEDSLVGPLGLANTYVAERIDDGWLVPGYDRYADNGSVMENVIARYHPGWCKTGLVVSTAEVTARFYAALFEGEVVGAEMLDGMLSCISIGFEAEAFFANPSYGFGLMIDPDSKYGRLAGHGGSGPGANTFAMHLPDFNGRRLTMAVFCNTFMEKHPFGLINDLLRVLERD